MARVKLELPARLPFAIEIDVRVTDVNYGGHLGNDALLSLVHEARVRFLREHGLCEGNVDGTLLIMTDAVVVYRAEAFAGDRLHFEVGAGDATRVSCDFFYRCTRVADGKLVAEAKTGVAFLDPATRRVVALPPSMLALAAA